MKICSKGISILCLFAVLAFTQCSQKPVENPPVAELQKPDFGGFASQVEWGQHLVTITGCNDCHTPKKMGPYGPVLDSALLLSGHPAQMPAPDVDRAEMEKKGLAVTQTLTAWVGPWGISFAGNLTSDPTGIGAWQEENFIRALREGKLKGMENGRQLLPPMPWDMFKAMTDNELKAMFAFLKTTKPISNIVPQAVPPASVKQ